MLVEPWRVENGHILLPQAPGLGVQIDEKELATQCKYREELGGEFLYDSDGSVADW